MNGPNEIEKDLALEWYRNTNTEISGVEYLLAEYRECLLKPFKELAERFSDEDAEFDTDDVLYALTKRLPAMIKKVEDGISEAKKPKKPKKRKR